MFTTLVRDKLATDYGIRDIPHDLLCDWCQRFRARYSDGIDRSYDAVVSNVAFLVASRWQRGMSTIVL